MNERTFKTYLYNIWSIALALAWATSSFPLQAQYKSNAPFTALLRHADSSETAQPYTLFEYDEAFKSYFKDKNVRKKGSGYKQYPRWRNYWSYFTKDGVIQSPKELYQAYQNKINANRSVNSLANWSPLGPYSAEVINDQVPGIGRLNQIAVDPSNPNTWYVGAPAGGLWKSTDAGNTWTNLFDEYPQIGVSGIAIDPEDTQIIYIATGDDDALESYSIGVMKSTDGGQTFSATGLNVDNVNRGTALNEITIDPDDHNTIWVAGTQGLYKSTNAGESFSRVINDEITDFRLKPGNSQVIYALSNSSFYRSTNGGTSFSQNATDPNSILPRSYMRAVMDVSAANPEVLYILYAKSSDGSLEGLYRSTDSGVTFSKRSVKLRESRTGPDGNPYTYFSEGPYDIMESNQAWFDLAIAVDPEDANTVYAGCLNIWKSSDGGNSFSKLNNWDDPNEAYTHADIHTLKFFDGALFAATDGGLYRSADGGKSFTDYSNNGIATGQFYRIGISKLDSSKLVGGTQDNAGFIRLKDEWYLYTTGDGMDYEIDPKNSSLSYGFAQRGIALFRSKNNGTGLDIFWGPDESGEWITPLTISGDGSVYTGYSSTYILGVNGLYKRSNRITSGGIDNLEASISDPNILWASDVNKLFFSSDAGFNFLNVNSFENSITDLVIDEQNPRISYIVLSERTNMDYMDNYYDETFNDKGSVYKVEILSNGESIITDLTKDIPQDQALFSIELNELDPNKSIFVGTSLGVYRTNNQMQLWERYDTGLPHIAVSDLELDPSEGYIVASTYGRGIFISKIEAFPPTIDLSILSLENSSTQITKKGEYTDLKAVIKNDGSQTIDTLFYSISSNSGITSHTKVINLNPRDSIEIIHSSIEIKDTGYNSIRFAITNTEDQDKSNNSSTSNVLASYETNSNTATVEENGLIPYDDNGGQGSWIYTDFEGEISENLTITQDKIKVYKTNNYGQDYPNNERSYLLTPFYNLVEYEQPVISFNMAFELEPDYDILNVQYSQDGGGSWKNLGSINSKPIWYNSQNSDCQYCLGGQWTGVPKPKENGSYEEKPRQDENILKNYQYDFILNSEIDPNLPDLKREAIFRITLQTDDLIGFSGVAIHNFQLTDLNYQAPPAEEEPETPVDPGTEETLDIPSTAFAVSVTDATCPQSETGIIEASLQDSAPDGSYTATLHAQGSVVGVSQALAPNTQFNGLAAGIYTLCITTDQSSSFKRCYTIEVKEPQGLEVQSFVNSQAKQLTLNLNGADTYTILFNGKTITTSQQQVILDLDRIENSIEVRGDTDCQGIFVETLVLSNEIFIYPNPVDDGNVNFYLGNTETDKVTVRLHNRSGSLLLEKTQPLFDKKTQLSVKGLASGLYFLSLTDPTTKVSTTHKLIIR